MVLMVQTVQTVRWASLAFEGGGEVRWSYACILFVDLYLLSSRKAFFTSPPPSSRGNRSSYYFIHIYYIDI
jgi:hypothetical protein